METVSPANSCAAVNGNKAASPPAPPNILKSDCAGRPARMTMSKTGFAVLVTIVLVDGSFYQFNCRPVRWMKNLPGLENSKNVLKQENGTRQGIALNVYSGKDRGMLAQ